jgi:hypothetical protein
MLDSRQKCLETRMTGEGFVRRRYQMVDGSRLTTYEIPSSVFSSFSRKTMGRQMAAAVNGHEARMGAAARRSLVLKMNAAGVRSSIVAREVGCTEARVRQIVAEAKKKGGAA